MKVPDVEQRTWEPFTCRVDTHKLPHAIYLACLSSDLERPFSRDEKVHH